MTVDSRTAMPAASSHRRPRRYRRGAAFATMAPLAEPCRRRSSRRSSKPVAIRTDALIPRRTTYRREERFQRGDTLAGVLLRLGVAEADVERLRSCKLRALQQLRPGRRSRAEVSADGTPHTLSFLSGRDTLVASSARGEGFRVTERRAQLEHADRDEGERDPQLALRRDRRRRHAGQRGHAARDIFAGDIDFHRDLRKGDRFSVVYELHHLDGRPVRAGRVLAAEFVNQRQDLPRGATSARRLLHAPTARTCARRSCARRSSFRASARASAAPPPDPADVARAQGHRLRGARPARACAASATASSSTPGRKGGYGNVVIVRHHGQYTTRLRAPEPHRRGSAARAWRRTTRSASSARPAGPPGRTCITSSASPARRATRSPSPCRPARPIPAAGPARLPGARRAARRAARPASHRTCRAAR